MDTIVKMFIKKIGYFIKIMIFRWFHFNNPKIISIFIFGLKPLRKEF